MRIYFFYILFICAFTKSFGKNEDVHKSLGDELSNFEQEGKSDIENLLSSTTGSNFSVEVHKPFDVIAPRSKLMESIDKTLTNTKTKKKHKKNLNFRRGVQIQNSPLYLTNATESSDIVNYVNIKPEVYPLSITDDKDGNKEIVIEKRIELINNPYHANDNDKLSKLLNTIDTKHNNETFIRTATVPMSENIDLGDYLNKLHIKQEVIPTRQESDTKVVLLGLLDKLHARSANHLRSSNIVVDNHLDELDNKHKHRDYSDTILLRSAVVDNVNSNTNERFHELIKYKDVGKILRTRRQALSHDPRAARHDDHRSRHRRSSGTQAGYTQDPDTCKTYNENLIKLWSNLSKVINVKAQPKHSDLHNIAIMIQAYLEHQNKVQPTIILKAKHKGPRDKTREIIHRIRKLLNAEGSAEKITKIIVKYLRPHYKDLESKDCQQVNEESLAISVDLLYKGYILGKTNCQGEDDGMTRNKKVSLRQRQPKTKNIAHMTFSMENSDHKPHLQNIHSEDESYEDFPKEKDKNQNPPNKIRRVFKSSRQQRYLPAYRTGNHNERENLNTRSKPSSNSTNMKLIIKSSLKSNVEKSKCEKYATRKLVVSLRPVIERFMGLLECEPDNSPLRSAGFNRDSVDPYYRPVSKLYSNENSGRDDYDYDYIQSAPFYEDYDEFLKTHLNEFPSSISPSSPLKDKINTSIKSMIKQVVTPNPIDENGNHFQYEDEVMFYGDDSLSAEKYDQFLKLEIETSTKNTPFIDLKKLKSDDQLFEEKSKIHVNTFVGITEFLKTARDESLKTPELAVPFALDTNKGYVELTYLKKYPKLLVYRPQFLVKNTMPYDDFLKTMNNIPMTNEDVRLMKIVRHLPNGSVQVLFQTEDSEASLEIRNLKDEDTRNNGSQDPVVDYQRESRIDANENKNADLMDGNVEDFSPNYHNEVLRHDFELPVKSDNSSSDGHLSSDLDLITVSDTLKGNVELSQTSSSDTNSTSNSTHFPTFPNSSESGSNWSSTLPSLFANASMQDFNKEIDSAVTPHIGAGIQQELDTQISSSTASNLHVKLNETHTSQLRSLPPRINSQSDMNSQSDSPSGSYSASNSDSHLNSHSGSWLDPLPNTDSNNQEVGNNFPSSTLSIVPWWRKWKSVIKEEIKEINGKMANLEANYKRLFKPITSSD